MLTGAEDGSIAFWYTTEPFISEKPFATIQHFSNLPSGHKGHLTGVTFTPDGLFIISAGYETKAGSAQGSSIKLWNAQTRQELRLMKPSGISEFSGMVQRLIGDKLITASVQHVQVWSLSKLSPVLTFKASYQIAKIVLSPDNSTFAIVHNLGSGSSTKARVEFWSLKGQKQAHYIEYPKAHILSLAWRADGKAVIFSTSLKNVVQWDATKTTTKPIQSTPASNGAYTVITLKNTYNTASQKAEQILTLGNETTPGKITFGTLSKWEAYTHIYGHIGSISAMAWNPDGSLLVSAGTKGVIRLWYCPKDCPLTGNIVTAGSSANRLSLTFDGSKETTSFTFSRESTLLLASSKNGKLQSWSLLASSGKALTEHTLAPKQDNIPAVSFCPYPGEANMFAMTRKNNAELRKEPPTKLDAKLLFSIPTTSSSKDAHTAPVNGLSWSKENLLLATASDDGFVKIWDLFSKANTASLLNRYPISTSSKLGAAKSISFSNNGERLYAGYASGDILILQVPGYTKLAFFKNGDPKAPIQAVTAIAAHPENAVFATGSAHGKIRLWHVTKHLPKTKELAPIGPTNEHHTKKITGLSFSPNGKYLASVSEDGSLKIWTLSPDRTGRTSVKTFSNYHSGKAITAVSWSSDGKKIVTGTQGPTVHVKYCK